MGNKIYGRNPVLEFLKKEKKAQKLYIRKGNIDGSLKVIHGLARDKRIPIQFTDKRTLDEMSNFGVHQGVCLMAEAVEYVALENILALAKKREEVPFILLLDGILDPHNYGAIIRSAEVAGVHGIIVPKHNQAPISDVVQKSSAGAVNHILISQMNITDAIIRLKKENIWIYGADADGDRLWDTNLKGPCGIVIGSEGKGLSKGLFKHLDGVISIPVKGKIDSLNASNASAVLLFECVRQNATS